MKQITLLLALLLILPSCGFKMPSDQKFDQFADCGPMPLEQTIAEDRLTVVFDKPERISRICYDKAGFESDIIKALLAPIVMPLACAYWETFDDPCKPHWTVYSPTGNRFIFDHELKHVEGFKD